MRELSSQDVLHFKYPEKIAFPKSTVFAPGTEFDIHAKAFEFQKCRTNGNCARI